MIIIYSNVHRILIVWSEAKKKFVIPGVSIHPYGRGYLFAILINPLMSNIETFF